MTRWLEGELTYCAYKKLGGLGENLTKLEGLGTNFGIHVKIDKKQSRKKYRHKFKRKPNKR